MKSCSAGEDVTFLHVFGEEAKELQETIDDRSKRLAGMRDGTLKVFQRIATKKIRTTGLGEPLSFLLS